MKKLILIFCFIACVYSYNIYGQKSKFTQEEKKAQFIYFLSEANKNRLLENYSKAIEQYNTAIDLNPKSASSYFYLSTIYFNNEQLQTAKNYIEKAVKLQPENMWYTLAYGDILFSSNLFEKSLKIYNELLDKHFNIEAVYDRIEKIYKEKKQVKELIVLYEKKYGHFNDETSALILYELYLKEKKFDKAEKLLEKLIVSNPENSKYKALKAEFYLTTNQIDKAIKLYQNLKNKYPDDIYIALSYAYYCKYSGLTEEYYKEVKLLISSEIDFLVKTELLYTGQYPNFNQIRYIELLNDLYKLHSDELITNTLMAEYYLNIEEKAESVKYIKKAVTLSNNDFNLVLTLFELYYDTRAFQILYDESKKFLEIFPNKAKVYFYNAVASYHLKNYNKSIEILMAGIDFAEYDNLLLVQFQYYLAENYHYINDFKNSDLYFEKAIAGKENFDLAMNSYALYLSERDTGYDRAKELSEKCIRNKPNNPLYNYTYAYILYVNKEYDKAMKYSEIAITAINNKTDFLELHGNILFVKGLKDKALHFWKESEKNGNNNEKLLYKIKNINTISEKDL